MYGEEQAATIDNPCPIFDAVHNRTVLLFMRNGECVRFRDVIV